MLKDQTKAIAMWTARVTTEANSHSLAPYRDSTASKARKDKERRITKLARQHLRTAGLSVSNTNTKQSAMVARPTQLGGINWLGLKEELEKGVAGETRFAERRRRSGATWQPAKAWGPWRKNGPRRT